MGFTETPVSKIYVNEHLTAYLKGLHKKARDLRPGVKYIWVREGKILARKAEGFPVITIKCEDDMAKLT